MARVLIATQAWGVIQDRSGNVSVGTTVAVKNTDGSPATHWSAQTGGSSSTVDQTTDSNGGIQRWIEEGEYDAIVGGVTTRVQAVNGTITTRSQLSLFGATVGARIPFAANPAINGPAAVASGTTDVVGVALNPKLSGDFTGIAGADPGFAWGMNLFAIVDTDANGLTNIDGALIELDFLKTKGIVNVARGLETGVALFGAGVGAKLTQVEGARISAPTRKAGQTTFSATTTSANNVLTSVGSFSGGSSFSSLVIGQYVTGAGIPTDTTITALNSGAATVTISNNATASATITVNLGTFQDAYTLFVEDVGSIATGSKFSLFVAGGVTRFGGRVDVASTIASTDSTALSLFAGFSAADGAQLQLLTAANTGHFRARLAVTNAEFQVHDNSSVNWSVSRTGLPKWNAAGNQQTTVGAAGGGSALPATPVKYLKVVDSAGTTLVIPAYNP